MGMKPIEMIIQQWRVETLTAEQAIGQILQHLVQVRRELNQVQADCQQLRSATQQREVAHV